MGSNTMPEQHSQPTPANKTADKHSMTCMWQAFNDLHVTLFPGWVPTLSLNSTVSPLRHFNELLQQSQACEIDVNIYLRQTTARKRHERKRSWHCTYLTEMCNYSSEMWPLCALTWDRQLFSRDVNTRDVDTACTNWYATPQQMWTQRCGHFIHLLRHTTPQQRCEYRDVDKVCTLPETCDSLAEMWTQICENCVYLLKVCNCSADLWTQRYEHCMYLPKICNCWEEMWTKMWTLYILTSESCVYLPEMCHS